MSRENVYPCRTPLAGPNGDSPLSAGVHDQRVQTPTTNLHEAVLVDPEFSVL